MLDRRFPFSLYCQITRETAAGPVASTPDDPEAEITVSIVAEDQGAQEVQVRNDQGGLDTKVAVRKLNSVTSFGGRVIRRGGGQQEALFLLQSALHRIPQPSEGNLVEVPLQEGLQAVVDTGPDIPRIRVLNAARRAR